MRGVRGFCGGGCLCGGCQRSGFRCGQLRLQRGQSLVQSALALLQLRDVFGVCVHITKNWQAAQAPAQATDGSIAHAAEPALYR
jgi:hypothetical protein